MPTSRKPQPAATTMTNPKRSRLIDDMKKPSPKTSIQHTSKNISNPLQKRRPLKTRSTWRNAQMTLQQHPPIFVIQWLFISWMKTSLIVPWDSGTCRLCWLINGRNRSLTMTCFLKIRTGSMIWFEAERRRLLWNSTKLRTTTHRSMIGDWSLTYHRTKFLKAKAWIFMGSVFAFLVHHLPSLVFYLMVLP